MGRRIGRWVYDDSDRHWGAAGWHLDGSPVVIDFMPGDHSCCNGGRRCCRGCYLLYNWPHYSREHEPVATHLADAMELVEEWWDAEQEAIAKGLPAGWSVSASHLPGDNGWTFTICIPQGYMQTAYHGFRAPHVTSDAAMAAGYAQALELAGESCG